MKQRFKTAIKFITFTLIACLLVLAVNEWMRPKFYFDGIWSPTNTYQDFYKLDKNTVDVLLLGSSHAITAFNPQVIYDNYGITSYNLSSEQQSILISYYWLEEALKYQSPKVVVLDAFTLHKYTEVYVYNDLNCSEGAIRKAMDNMRFSPLKIKAAKEIAEIDPTQDALSFFLLNIRYHSRWTGLFESDYYDKAKVNHGGIKGYNIIGGLDPGAADVTLDVSDLSDVEPEPMIEIADEYLGRIVDLCKENNIQLILTNTPYLESIERYKSVAEYANSHDIPYYDFNEENLYNEIGYSASENLLYHPNYTGAEKLSDYMGKIFAKEYGITPRIDDSFAKSKENYEHKVQNLKLKETADIYEYLDMLNNDDYTVFIFASNDYSDFIDEEMAAKIKSLGFETDLRNVDAGTHYFGVNDKTNMREELTGEDFAITGAFRKGLGRYSCTVDTSLMVPDFHTYSMQIDGVECGNNFPGINIVVYDNEEKTIIEKVNVNSRVEVNSMTRY
ncbi:MAG: hypothetical protein J6X45_06450 [Lachnospiraceae bacterium]|nr:hypothetical protein [Lachnospiraceae bacterium]